MREAYKTDHQLQLINAISFLEKSIQNKTFPLVSGAYLYLELAHLKKDNIELAKENFKKSITENSKAFYLS